MMTMPGTHQVNSSVHGTTCACARAAYNRARGSRDAVGAANDERGPLVRLQRALGNHAFGRMVQTKLRIGPAGDAFEQEADRVAERLGALPFAAAPASPTDATRIAEPNGISGHDGHGTVRRKCAACEREELLQRKAVPNAGIVPESASDAGLPTGGGTPMPAELRGHFEPHFGVDFSAVRFHTGADAARNAEALNARAFTVGANVAFGPGMYAPGSVEGRKLIAHELTHVVQQAAAPAARGTLQRAMRLQDPGSHTTYLSPQDNQRTRAELLQGWLNQLCSDGQWTVDGATGAVASGAPAGFCAPAATPGSPHHSTSGAPTSCGCLCQFVRPGGSNVDIVIDQRYTASRWIEPGRGNPPLDIYTIEDQTHDFATGGEGGTLHPKDYWLTNDTVGVTGRSAGGIRGAGDTNPRSAGTAGNQVLRDPPWIILGHEICGHVLHPDSEDYYHAQTPEGNVTAVDIENRIRREHSTAANNYGIRRGDGAGGNAGSVVVVRANENGPALCTRLGIPQGAAAWNNGEHQWLFSNWSGDPYDRDSYNAIAAGDRLFARGVFYHDVMAGETMAAIARMWGVTAAAIQRANPGVTGQPAVGARLLIPNA